MEHMARRQLALDAFHEEAYHQVMRALAWSGQRNAALAQYMAYRGLLKQELGIEPSRETARLYEQILSEKLEPPRLPLDTHARFR
jgi:DNA-binding SARP family transcriptional activator